MVALLTHPEHPHTSLDWVDQSECTCPPDDRSPVLPIALRLQDLVPTAKTDPTRWPEVRELVDQAIAAAVADPRYDCIDWSHRLHALQQNAWTLDYLIMMRVVGRARVQDELEQIRDATGLTDQAVDFEDLLGEGPPGTHKLPTMPRAFLLGEATWCDHEVWIDGLIADGKDWIDGLIADRTITRREVGNAIYIRADELVVLDDAVDRFEAMYAAMLADTEHASDDADQRADQVAAMASAVMKFVGLTDVLFGPTAAEKLIGELCAQVGWEVPEWFTTWVHYALRAPCLFRFVDPAVSFLTRDTNTEPGDQTMAAVIEHDAEVVPITELASTTASTAKPTEISKDSDARSSWDEIDIAAILSGDLDEEPPVFLLRTDKVPLLYREKVHSIIGEPESCKGWFSCAAAAHALELGEHVLYVDFEDTAKGILSRMRSLGVDVDVLVARFHYVAPEEKFGKKERAALQSVHRSCTGRIGIVVFDGITQALSNQGFSSNDGDEVAKFIKELPRKIAHKWGAAVLLVDHVTKDKDGRGRYAVGSFAKLAGIDVQYSAEVVAPLARGKNGHVRIKVAKDRPAHVRAHAVGTAHMQRIAEMKLESLAEGRVVVTLEKPEGAQDAGGAAVVWRPTTLMQRVSEHLGRHTTPCRREDVLKVVTGNRDQLIKAIDFLVADGFAGEITVGQAREYRNLRAYPPASEVGEK
jgi:hypothetical protein